MPQGIALDLEISEPVVVNYCQWLGHILAHLLDQRKGGGIAAQVDLACWQALNCPGPSPTSVIITNHLQRHTA